MKYHSIDIDDAIIGIKNSSAKNYIKEAIDSYRIGAYRSSVLVTWISICVDIIEKIKELSLSGDKLATELYEKINKIPDKSIDKMLSMEKQLLDIAYEKLELISLIEKRNLERIQEDRNLCAHPTFISDGDQFNPSPDICREYIQQAITYLLSQPPVKGKTVIKVIVDLINGETFPEDNEKAYLLLSSNHYLGKTKKSSISNLLIVLFKRIFCDNEPFPQPLFKKYTSAIYSIKRLEPEIYKDVIKDKINKMLAEANDNLFKRLFPFLIDIPSIFDHFEDIVLIRLTEIIQSISEDELIKYHVPKTAEKIEYINIEFQKRILTIEDLPKIIKIVPSEIFKDKAIELFIDSSTFVESKKLGINVLLPHVKFFTEHDLEVLLSGTIKNESNKINQILSVDKNKDLFVQIYNETKNEIINYKKIWLNFWEELKDDFDFDELKECLENDDVIEKPKDVTDDYEDDFPF